MDPLGNPILVKNRKGDTVDKDGNRVNKRGYLIDEHGIVKLHPINKAIKSSRAIGIITTNRKRIVIGGNSSC